jgi:anti-sigma regulatory factor (Ser/Thr protein kinase)
MKPPIDAAAGQFAGTAASVAQARALVARTLGADWAGLDDVLVMVSELASNAVRHTASGTDGAFGVAVSAAGHTARVEVSDAGGMTRPAIPDPDAGLTGDGGRGLRIVDALADGWGHDGDETGRVVWFEITGQPEVTGQPGSIRPAAAAATAGAPLTSDCGGPGDPAQPGRPRSRDGRPSPASHHP